MTKSESLLSTCTKKQLADMVVEKEIGEFLKDSINRMNEEKFKDKFKELQSEVEKYRKAFEDAKKERDCQIVEYQKKIEKLYNSLRTLEGNLKVSNVIIGETIKNENGEKTNTVKFESIKQFAEYVKCFYAVNIDYIQKVLHEQKQNVAENKKQL